MRMLIHSILLMVKLMILQFNPLRTGRGWVNVMESALKLIRQNMELSQPSSGAMTPYQPQALLPDSSTAIKSIFLSIGNLLKRTDIQNILLNINFAAIHIALLRAVDILYHILSCISDHHG